MTDIIVVKASHDPDADVWYTDSSDIQGLRIEAPTLDSLPRRIPGAVLDLLQNDESLTAREIPIEVIARASTRVRIPERI